MEMDMVIPLNLNSKKRKENVQQLPNCDSASNEGSSPSKVVLGPEQAKRRLLAFAQQLNKTKENLNTDNNLQKRPNRHGILKYTYVVEGEDCEEISFPAHIIQYTKTEPQISYCENPHYAKGVFQSRKEIFDAADEDTKRIMNSIMNSTTPLYQNREFAGRYRKWYVSKKMFVGKSLEDSENMSFSTHWETDSEDESSYRDNTDYDMEFLPKPPPSLLNTTVVSKVKINKVELPFFEDDDFLTSLISSQSKVKKEIILEPSKSETKAIQEECSAFMSSLKNINEKLVIKQEPIELPVAVSQNIGDEKEVLKESKYVQVRKSYSPNLSLENTNDKIETRNEIKFEPSQSPKAVDRNFEDGVMSSEIKDNGIRKRSAPSPDWDEQWRSSRYRPSRESTSGTSPIPRKEPNTPDENSKENDWEGGNECSRLGDIDAIDGLMSDAKRISLDERLELELGIKVESEIPTTTSVLSPQSVTDQYSWSFDSCGMSTSPVKRARGFGPKAAPLGPWILHCRNRALPAAPYVPPHLQSVLYQPLVRTIPPKTEDDKANDVHHEENEINKTDTQSQDLAPDQEIKKDWDKELKNLEAVASNLEVADETVLEALEEKLMQFETSNILLSGESPTFEAKNDKTKAVKKGKRSKPPPVELKEAGKGILVMPRISLLDEKSGNQKKAVVFADSVRPGYGTSSEDEDEHGRSPPPPVVQPVHLIETSPKKKCKKPQKEKIVGDDFDPVFDLLPPPPPPPGSPEPPQIEAMIPPSSPTLQLLSPPTAVTDALVASSPQPIESSAC
ncbi:cyclin-dependent kinase 12-like isoform X2 [Daphnia pulicaria]|uniref:cyclin-dependent kinase 12-like isoform X2 n=1 Tax=Daphnia pulicaria TaxID=35523 RepID=UPI001EEB9CDF|nr:cyclin-dependent kinase 12-like isoform X2 [Daphnia pulicaria]